MTRKQNESDIPQDIEESPELEQMQQESTIEQEELELGLDEQLAEATAKAAEYLDGWQRSRAELANYRRRTEAQRAEMALAANKDLLLKLLPALDDLKMALGNSPDREAGIKAWQEWRDGMALIAHKFEVVFNGVGVVLIESEGQEFDPNVHEAISYEPHPDFESGQIIEQVRPGYMLGDRVLRAAMVRVAQ